MARGAKDKCKMRAARPYSGPSLTGRQTAPSAASSQSKRDGGWTQVRIYPEYSARECKRRFRQRGAVARNSKCHSAIGLLKHETFRHQGISRRISILAPFRAHYAGVNFAKYFCQIFLIWHRVDSLQRPYRSRTRSVQIQGRSQPSVSVLRRRAADLLSRLLRPSCSWHRSRELAVFGSCCGPGG